MVFTIELPERDVYFFTEEINHSNFTGVIWNPRIFPAEVLYQDLMNAKDVLLHAFIDNNGSLEWQGLVVIQSIYEPYHQKAGTEGISGYFVKIDGVYHIIDWREGF